METLPEPLCWALRRPWKFLVSATTHSAVLHLSWKISFPTELFNFDRAH